MCVCVLHTVPWKCREPAVLVEWPPLCPLNPAPADRGNQTNSLKVETCACVCVCSISVCVPQVALPGGCGRPKTEARGEQSPGAEAPQDPRTGLYLWVTQLQTAPLVSEGKSNFKKVFPLTCKHVNGKASLF